MNYVAKHTYSICCEQLLDATSDKTEFILKTMVTKRTRLYTTDKSWSPSNITTYVSIEKELYLVNDI